MAERRRRRAQASAGLAASGPVAVTVCGSYTAPAVRDGSTVTVGTGVLTFGRQSGVIRIMSEIAGGQV